MRWNAKIVLGAWLALAVTSCIDDRPFVCLTNDDCKRGSEQGICQEAGSCSFDDDDCLSGQRYAEFSGVVSGKCVPVDMDAGAATGSVTAGGSGGGGDGVGSDMSFSSGGSGGSTDAAAEVGTAGGASAGGNVDSDLVLWLTFDNETPVDSSDYQHTVVCGDSCPVLTSGQFGAAGAFDGASLQVMPHEVLEFSGDFTITMWFLAEETAIPNLHSALIAQTYDPLGKADRRATYELLVRDNYDNGAPYELVAGGEGSGASMPNTVETGEWRFLSSRVSDGWQLVKADDEIMTTSGLGEISVQLRPIGIGAYQEGDGLFYGAIDDLRIYRRALSDLELTAVRDGGRP